MLKRSTQRVSVATLSRGAPKLAETPGAGGWSRRRGALLATSAFTGAFITAIAGNPQSALAACAGENTANVTCNAANPATAGTLNTTFAGSTLVNVNAGGAITTGGAAATVAAAGNLTFNHNDPGGITSLAGTGVTLTNNFGNVAFTGNAPVIGRIGIATSSAGSGTSTVDIASDVTGNNSIAVQTTTVNGSNTVNMTGGIVTPTTRGISATSNGTGNININVTGGQIVGTPSVLGIDAISNGSASNISITTSTTSIIPGINASTAAGSSGNISITANSPVTGVLVGITAQSGGTGTVTVTGAGKVSGGPGSVGGIFATATGIGPGAGVDGISVLGTGDTSAQSNMAIFANISNAANNSNIVVNRSGKTFGNVGISAGTAGGGNVTVTASNDVTSPFVGIFTTTVGGLNTVNVTAGTVKAFLSGISANSGTGNINVNIGAGATVSGLGTYGVVLTGGTTNTIANSGAISGATGVFTSSGTTAVNNAGSVTGTNGTAVRLGGANNLFVMDGPLAVLTGSAIGSGSDTFRLAGSGANSFDVSQIGAGWTAFDKAGSSTWTLTGTATYAGPATVNAGTLLVNGSLASASGLTVNAGGTVGGIGTLPKTTINGGTLSPGNSIGTIAIAGHLTFVGPGTYLVEVSPAAADQTNVNGSATLAGAVQVNALSGGIFLPKRYTILNANSIGGTFGSLTVNGDFGPAVHNPHLEYDANNVFLVLDPAAISPLLVGGTRNERAVAHAIDTALQAGVVTPLFLGLFNLTPRQLAGALDALSGEVHASTKSALMDESLYARGAVLGRLRQASYGEGSMASLAVGGPLAFQNGEELSSALAYGKSPLPAKARPMAPAPSHDITFWAQGFGAWGRFNSDGNATSLNRNLAGFFSGADMRFGDGRAGIAAGYTGSHNNLDRRGGSTVETGHLAGYGGWRFGALSLRAGAAYAFHTIDTDRTIAFPGFFDRATAHYAGRTGQIFGETGYGFAFGNIAVEPFAGGAWVDLHTDAAVERGGAAALNLAAGSFTVGYSTLGVRAASMIPIGHDMVLVPRASLAWQHAFNDMTPSASLAFRAAPAPFVITGVPIARDAALAEAGLDLAIGRHATVGISYTGQLAGNVQDHAAKGKFSWKF